MAVHTIYNDDLTNLTEEEQDYVINYAYDDELVNLKVPTTNRIIAIADLGLWNGRKQGYKVSNNRMLSDVLTIGNEEYNHLYYDGFNVRKDSTHHDGTNHILFREFKDNVDEDKFMNMVYNGEPISNEVLNRYTRSLRRYVKQVYGW